MLDLFGVKKRQLGTILDRQGVRLAVFFGSQITGQTHPASDIDIGVSFEKQPNDLLMAYTDLDDAFKQYFGRKTKKNRLQIVDLDNAPLSLRFKAIENGKLLYAKSAKSFVDYREKTALEYFDFKPVEDYCKKVFLGQSI